MQTYIPGKDAALETSIAHFQQQLQHIGMDIEPTSWLNPVPTVWSVHLKDNACGLCFTNGKGTTKKAALASALGEYIERLSTNYFFADFYLGKSVANAPFVHYPNEEWFPIPEDNTLPSGLLTPKLWAFYDPDSQLTARELVDLQSSNPDRGICALPFIEQRSQKTVYFPMNIIGNLYVSNGMSAGNSPAEARVQALSEIFERYVKNKIIADATSLPLIPDAVLARYPTVTNAIASLEHANFFIYCYDASLGGQFPVICVVLFNRQNHTCFASFGAHPDFGVALERTVTELLQGRELKDLDQFSSPSFDYDDIADHTNLETHFIDSSGLIAWDLFRENADYPFVDWIFSGTTDDECKTLSNIIYDNQYELYIADYTHLGVYACRIIVAGMSEIYPPDDLRYANNNMGISLRDRLLCLPDAALAPQAHLDLITYFDDNGFDDMTRVRELLGLATGSDNAWFTLRIGELKAMLSLAGGDLEQALTWVEWTLEFSQSTFTPERYSDYHCLRTLITFCLTHGPSNFTDFQLAFSRLYTQTRVDTLWAVVQGNQHFHGLFSVDDDLSQFPAHQALLATYQKLQRAKQAQSEV